MAMAEIGNLLQQASGKDLSSISEEHDSTTPWETTLEVTFKIDKLIEPPNHDMPGPTPNLPTTNLIGQVVMVALCRLDIDSDTIPGTMLNEFDFKALTESILKTHLCQLDFFKGEGFDTIERGDITTHIVGDFDPSESELIKSLSPADAIHRHHPAALGT